MEAKHLLQVQGLVEEGWTEVLAGTDIAPSVAHQLVSCATEVFEDPEHYGIDTVPHAFDVVSSFHSKGVVRVKELLGKLKYEAAFYHRQPMWYGFKHYMIEMRVKAARDFRSIAGSNPELDEIETEPPVSFSDLLHMHEQQQHFYQRPVESAIVKHWCDKKNRLPIELSQLMRIHDLM